MTFKEKFEVYLNKVNKELDTLFLCSEIPEKRVYDAARYSLSAGGKRIKNYRQNNIAILRYL